MNSRKLLQNDYERRRIAITTIKKGKHDRGNDKGEL